jgi:hypothetical protein
MTNVRFRVLTAVSMKIIVFWDVAHCSHTAANILQQPNDWILDFQLP